MKQLTRNVGMTAVDLDSYFYFIMKFKEWSGKGRVAEKNIYKPFGYFYGPFRSFNTGVPNLEDYQILLVLRDPRDAVVSGYYSYLYSHRFPVTANRKYIKREIQTREKIISETTLDDYAIRAVNSKFLERYYTYYKELIGKPNVLFLRYEDMVVNFSGWLKRIVEFFRLDVSQKTLDEIIENSNFRVEKEDIYSHKRQVTPGDYKRKLKTGTIEKMNEKWEEILKLLDYQ